MVSNPPRGSETIILAEDYEGLREITRTVLESHGYTVIEAVNGRDAVDKFRQAPESVDLVILDVAMPVMGGIQAYEEMAAIKPGLKSLFTSGHSKTSVGGRYADGSVLEFISKPSPPAVLLGKIRALLDNRP